MSNKTIVGLLAMLIISSCSQRIPKNEWPIKKNSNSQLRNKTLVRIESGSNQGLTHIDSLGTKYSYRHFTSTITNTNSFPIQIQIALSNEYDYPAPHNKKKYKVFLLPKELTPDTIALYNTNTVGLDNFLNRVLKKPYILNETLESGENCVVTIGTVYDNPTDCGIVPKVLFEYSNQEYFQACNPLTLQNASVDIQTSLWVKLVYCSNDCLLIPCGQISYSEG